jgi:acyl-CoA reductase-like NAD-dependent aldehyde dehydrogenase
VSIDAVDQGMNPYAGAPVGDPVPHTSADEVDRLAYAARAAAAALAALPHPGRADLLRAVAAALEAARDELVGLADAETGLGPDRLAGELTRTRVQLEMFADVVAEGSFLDVIIDPEDPAAVPVPRPDLRRLLVPIGPVAVFAASNFPFAFSVAGGDTASALAAGCPVVVKAHPGHPGLSARCSEVVATALAGAGAPDGAFALVHGLDAGRTLVVHPAIAAVGFTGSLAAGRALFDLASGRPDPIPFYGELGSLNPCVVSPGAVATRGPDVARGFVASFTLGAGQFCTKPGLLFLPEGHGLDAVLVDEARAVRLGPLLNARVRDGFRHTAGALAAAPGARSLLAESTVESSGYAVSPVLVAVSATDVVRHPEPLLEECFGPAAVVVEYPDVDELLRVLDAVPGALAAALHAEANESGFAAAVLDRLGRRAGRVIWNGWPTGVSVAWAQHHGGPWPATTAPLHTSVGATAVRRFLRPVVFQNVPDELLPEALRAANPLGLPRRVDGHFDGGAPAPPLGG